MSWGGRQICPGGGDKYVSPTTLNTESKRTRKAVGRAALSLGEQIEARADRELARIVAHTRGGPPVRLSVAGAAALDVIGGYGEIRKTPEGKFAFLRMQFLRAYQHQDWLDFDLTHFQERKASET